MILLPVLLLAASCGDTDGAAPAGDAADTTHEPVDTTPADTAPEPTETAPDPTEISSARTTDPPPTTTPSEAAPDPGDRSSSITQLAIADLAERLGIEGADEVVVVLSEDVTWRNGSLGCPEPGMSYTQALVDGFRVILEVDGVKYAYHSGRGQAPFLCAAPADNGTTTDT